MKTIKSLALSLGFVALTSSVFAGPIRKAAILSAAAGVWYANHIANTTQDFTKPSIPEWMQSCPLKPWDKWTTTCKNTSASLRAAWANQTGTEKTEAENTTEAIQETTTTDPATPHLEDSPEEEKSK